ncbi:MAG: sulfatase-like hydrolase/transferase [Phycisphaerae bacterium]|nr:sulfatase-like hydrolase/transferase [Phycisphaerae bacterium]
MHRRRDFLKATGAAAAALAAPRVLRAANRPAERPNVLLLFSDQHHAGVMGCEGHATVRTPHLDRLASEGVRFSRAYCSDGVCVPSRTAMFTGLYPRTTGVLYNADAPPEGDGLLPLHKLLRAGGYRTGAFGKMHLPRGLREAGWDASATTISPRQDPSEENYWDWVREKGQFDSHERDFKGSHAAPLMAQLSRTKPENRTTAYAAGKTIDFLRQCKKAGKPFFCWCSFIYPHQPYTPLPQWAALYDVDKIKLPANVAEPLANLPPALRNWRLKTTPPWNCGTAAKDHAIYRRYVAYYYALVSEIDHHIGGVLDELKRLGLDDNTIVIYASDHGDFVAGHGMVEKCAVGHNVYEDTLRVPLIFRWPSQFKGGAVRDDLASLLDLYPTILDLTGVKRPPAARKLDGTSLAPTLRTGKPLGRQYVVSENWSQVTVIGKRYKLGVWQAPGRRYAQWDFRKYGDMLFDRQANPLETKNLVGMPAMAAEEKRLRAFLARWLKQTDATGRTQVGNMPPRKKPARKPRDRT